MCWIEKDHDHYCPECTEAIKFSGSSEEYEASHVGDFTCPKCNKVFHFDDDGNEVSGEEKYV